MGRQVRILPLRFPTSFKPFYYPRQRATFGNLHDFRVSRFAGESPRQSATLETPPGSHRVSTHGRTLAAPFVDPAPRRIAGGRAPHFGRAAASRDAMIRIRRNGRAWAPGRPGARRSETWAMMPRPSILFARVAGSLSPYRKESYGQEKEAAHPGSNPKTQDGTRIPVHRARGAQRGCGAPQGQEGQPEARQGCDLEYAAPRQSLSQVGAQRPREARNMRGGQADNLTGGLIKRPAHPFICGQATLRVSAPSGDHGWDRLSLPTWSPK